MKTALWIFTVVIFLAGCSSTTRPHGVTVMSLEQTKQSLRGEWVSIATELRPSTAKNPDGSARAFYLTRDFKYLENDRFELTIVNAADPSHSTPLARIYLRGRMHWKGPHPIAAGAQKVDFVADEDYTVTPLSPQFADLLPGGANSFARPEPLNSRLASCPRPTWTPPC